MTQSEVSSAQTGPESSQRGHSPARLVTGAPQLTPKSNPKKAEEPREMAG